MSVVDEATAADEQYASGFQQGGLAMPPGRKFAVVTCMDARASIRRASSVSRRATHT
jgi:carbonic anhydrase